MKNNLTLDARKIAILGLLVALQIVFTRFASITLPFIRIGFDFFPIAITGILFGWALAGIASFGADLIGIFLFPSGAAFFPGFSLTAFLKGAIYGAFLYQQPKSMTRIIGAVVVESVVTLVLNSIWLYMMMGPAMFASLPARLINFAVMLPVKIVTLSVLLKNNEIQRLVGKIEK